MTVDNNTYNVIFYDGITSSPQPKSLKIQADGSLQIQSILTDKINSEIFTPNQYQWNLPVGKSPIILNLDNGGLLELNYNEDLLKILLSKQESSKNLLLKIETNFKFAISIFALASIVLVSIYFFVVPYAITVIQPLVPLSVKETVGKQGLLVLDKIMFSPTTLPIERQIELSNKFNLLAAEAELPKGLKVSFRSMGKDLPNAFALLPNQIIVTDGIVEQLSDDELFGVVGHELGHLFHDHVTQSLIRGSIVSVLTFALLGSSPELIETLAIGAIDAKYSQSHETEADLFGAILLKRIGKDPKSLANALRKLQLRYGAEGGIKSFMSSHPLTSDRILTINKIAGD